MRAPLITGDRSVPAALKILVAGGLGTGKTALVGSVAEAYALHAGEQYATVTLDIGRIDVDDEVVLFLLGTPVGDDFWDRWDSLAVGAVGAVVLVDAARPADCLPTLGYLVRRGTPFLVAVSVRAGDPEPDLTGLRATLGLGADVPVVSCDARDRDCVKTVLITLVDHVISRQRPGP